MKNKNQVNKFLSFKTAEFVTSSECVCRPMLLSVCTYELGDLTPILYIFLQLLSTFMF